MTVEQTIVLVEAETGRDGLRASTRLDQLGMDSLEYLNLLVAVGVTPERGVNAATIGDLAALID